MKTRIAKALKPAAFVVLPVLLGGCPADATSTATALQNVQTFIADFARQVLSAVLL